ncbi:MAG: beta strand repeat-containing protein, partial [Acidimicrobiales bacterium]
SVETVTVKDSTSAVVANDPVFIALTPTPAGACGTTSPVTGTTNASGVFVTTYTSSTTGGTCTLAAEEAFDGQTGSAVITQNAVNNLAVAASPTSIPGNGVSTSTVTATVTTAGGTPVPGDVVSFTPTGTCGTLSSPTATTNATGVASVTYTSASSAGFCTISATEAATGQIGSTVVTQTGSSASAVAITANPTTLPANGTSTSAITVTVSNTSGPVANDPVNLTTSPSVAGACGTVIPNSGNTNSIGQFTSTYTASGIAGTCTITATEANNGLTKSTTITQTAFNSVVLVPASQTVAANGSTTDVLTATVKNGSAVPVAGDTVTFTTSGGTTCGAVSPTSGTTNALGVVTTTYTSSTTSGFCVVVATESLLSGTGTAVIDQTSSPAPANTPFVVTVAPAAATLNANGTTTSVETVTVKNSLAAVVPNDPVFIVLTPAPAGACGTTSPVTGTTNASGQFVTTYTSSTTGGICTLTAQEANDGQTGSAAITQNAVNSVAVTATPSSIVGNGVTTSAVTATVTNSAGNPVPLDVVTFTDTGTCGTLSSPTATTNASGVAMVTYTSSNATGFCNITGTEAATGQSNSVPVIITQTH